MPTVSICIPAYNAELFIGQTLESLLNQTFQDFEIIVSDNHSTDSTADIVKRYQEKDFRITLTNCSVSRKDSSLLNIASGVVDNFNHVMTLAGSQFITLYHADDLYHSNILNEQVTFLNQHKDVSAVFSMGRFMDSDGKRVSSRSVTLSPYLKGKKIFDYNELLLALVVNRMPLMTPTCLMRREAMIKTGLWRDKYEQATDYDYWLRLAKTGPIGVIDRPLFLYRVGKHQGSFRGKTQYRYVHMPSIRLFEDHVMTLTDSGTVDSRLMDSLRVIKFEEDLRVASNLILNGKTLEATEILDQAISAIGNTSGVPRQTTIYVALLKRAVNFRMDCILVRTYMKLFEIMRSLKWKKRSLQPVDLGVINPQRLQGDFKV